MSEAEADLVVRNADHIITMTGEDIEGGWIAVKGGLISGMGASTQDMPSGTTAIDATGCLVTPGFINTHHHLYQNLTRNWAADQLELGLVPWLQELYPYWCNLDEESSYLSTWVGLAELALGGCTTASDHLNVHPRPKLLDAQITAAKELGVRFHPARGSMNLSQKDGAIPPDESVEDGDDFLADCERLIEQYHDPNPGAMVRVAIAPCNPFAVTNELMVESLELAERLDVRLHTHLAESPDEEQFTLDQYGWRPAERLQRLGWYTDRAWVAHAIFVNDAEIRAIGGAGVGVAHCPTSNVLFNRALTPARALRAAGAPVGLGVDGGASTGHGSLYNEARLAALLGDLLPGLPRLKAIDALEMATVGGAQCLGREGELGVLRPGAAGDLVVWPFSGLFFSGTAGDPVTAWLRDGPVRARDTIIAGKQVVRNGQLTNPALEEIVSRHTAVSQSWRHS